LDQLRNKKERQKGSGKGVRLARSKHGDLARLGPVGGLCSPGGFENLAPARR
jgi:hypothetical protein